MHTIYYRLVFQYTVLEDVPSRFIQCKGEVLRVSGAEKLKSHFHDFFAGEFAAREVIEDQFAMLGIELFALGNANCIGVLELEPPVTF